HRLANEQKRSIFYGQIALDSANEADQTFWKLAALNDLGIVHEIDSQFDKAIDFLHQALALLNSLADDEQQKFSRVAIYQNLGYNKILVGQTMEGIGMIESIIDSIQVPSSLSDSYIDLCYGYLDLEEYDKARALGEKGLDLAAEPRQV